MYDVLAERIIEALLTTTTQRAAATLAGVSERTIRTTASGPISKRSTKPPPPG